MKKRIKIGEVFSHPWVKSFEKNYQSGSSRKFNSNLNIGKQNFNNMEAPWQSAGNGFYKHNLENTEPRNQTNKIRLNNKLATNILSKNSDKAISDALKELRKNTIDDYNKPNYENNTSEKYFENRKNTFGNPVNVSEILGNGKLYLLLGDDDVKLSKNSKNTNIIMYSDANEKVFFSPGKKSEKKSNNPNNNISDFNNQDNLSIKKFRLDKENVGLGMDDNLQEREKEKEFKNEKNCSNNVQQDQNKIVTNILIMKKDTSNFDEVNQMIAEQCTLLSPIRSERSRNIKMISDNNLNSKYKDEIFDKDQMNDLKSKSINNQVEKKNEEDDKEILDFIISKVKTNKKSSNKEFIYFM